jgi:EAL domain-containing protein (putative c-di-GMP-specific phosphodiesterase class I)
LLDGLREHAVIGTEEELGPVTASIGIALFGWQGGTTGNDMLVNADLAMYDAKEAGRDEVVFASRQEGSGGPKRKPTWGKRIRIALSEDRFMLYAQPIKRVDEPEVNRFELLLRLGDQPGEAILPGEFLPIAERLDLVQEIDRWVVNHALQMLAGQAGRDDPATLEVNLSGRSVGDAGLVDMIERGIREHAIDPSRLVFEITETRAVANFHRARAFATRLTDLGCRFALDDFGAGFGSFYYLKHLPFDLVKIDGEFVRRCLESRTDRLVIEAIVRVSRGLGKHTVAEFVEDPETAAFLERQGVDFLQGYWVGRPEPATALLGSPRL